MNQHNLRYTWDRMSLMNHVMPHPACSANLFLWDRLFFPSRRRTASQTDLSQQHFPVLAGVTAGLEMCRSCRIAS